MWYVCDHMCAYMYSSTRAIPDISSVLPSVKGLGPLALYFAPVAGIDALMRESSRLS